MPKILIEFVVTDKEEAEEIVASLNDKSDCWEALADLARTDFEFTAELVPDGIDVRLE